MRIFIYIFHMTQFQVTFQRLPYGCPQSWCPHRPGRGQSASITDILWQCFGVLLAALIIQVSHVLHIGEARGRLSSRMSKTMLVKGNQTHSLVSQQLHQLRPCPKAWTFFFTCLWHICQRILRTLQQESCPHPMSFTALFGPDEQSNMFQQQCRVRICQVLLPVGQAR